MTEKRPRRWFRGGQRSEVASSPPDEHQPPVLADQLHEVSKGLEELIRTRVERGPAAAAEIAKDLSYGPIPASVVREWARFPTDLLQLTIATNRLRDNLIAMGKIRGEDDRALSDPDRFTELFMRLTTITAQLALTTQNTPTRPDIVGQDRAAANRLAQIAATREPMVPVGKFGDPSRVAILHLAELDREAAIRCVAQWCAGWIIPGFPTLTTIATYVSANPPKQEPDPKTEPLKPKLVGEDKKWAEGLAAAQRFAAQLAVTDPRSIPETLVDYSEMREPRVDVPYLFGGLQVALGGKIPLVDVGAHTLEPVVAQVVSTGRTGARTTGRFG